MLQLWVHDGTKARPTVADRRHAPPAAHKVGFARCNETTYTGKSAIDNRHDDSRPREPRGVVKSFGARPEGQWRNW